jgi:DNA modification methylase
MNQTEYETESFGKINLIHADCMDVLRALPDNSFDLALVDPPYGAGNQQVSDEIGGVQPLRGMVQPIQGNLPRCGTSADASRGIKYPPPQWSRFGGRFDRYKQPTEITPPKPTR